MSYKWTVIGVSANAWNPYNRDDVDVIDQAFETQEEAKKRLEELEAKCPNYSWHIESPQEKVEKAAMHQRAEAMNLMLDMSREVRYWRKEVGEILDLRSEGEDYSAALRSYKRTIAEMQAIFNKIKTYDPEKAWEE